MTEQASVAWLLVQISELVHRAEQMSMGMMRLLPPETRAEMPEEASATMAGAEVEELAIVAAEAAEIAEQVRQLTQGLPDEDVEIAYEDVREAAAADLAQGMLDPERAVVAARLLDVRTGWPALAEGLRTLDIRESWTGWAPRGMLAAFRDAGSELVGRALELAGIPPETVYADCTPEQLVRLAHVLDELGRGWRP